MAAPTIPNGETQFFPIIYEGNGAGQKVGKFVPFTDNFTVANSVLYNDDDSPYLTRTQESGTGDQKRKATFSWWFKRGSSFGTEMIHIGAAASTRLLVRFDTSDRLVFRLTNSTTEYQKVTNRTFEDTSKWYNCVWVIDVSQSTATDRSKVYIDGEQITSWSSDANPAQNTDVVGLADGTTQRIGCGSHFVGQIFDGYLAEFNYCDGQTLAPSDFGTTDTSTGRWIPVAFPTTLTTFTVTVANPGSGNKYYIDGALQATVTLQEGGVYRFDQSDSSNSTHPLRFSTTSDGSHGGGSEYTTGVTTNGTPGSTGAYTEITVASGAATLYYYCTAHSGMGGTANTPDPFGSNGFKLKFQLSNALGDDTSGKGNDFTSSGLTTTDQTTDSPTQNSNTFGSTSSGVTLSEGNLTVNTGTSGSYIQAVGQPAFGVRSGKWYWEVKITTLGAAVYGWKDDGATGGSQANDGASSQSAGLSTGSAGSFSAGSWFIDLDYDNEVNYTTVSTNDVLMFAMDLDSGKGYCGKNGTWFNSANPANGTGSIGGCHRANGINKFYPCANRLDTASVGEFNFGQKSFAYTAPTGFSTLQQDNLPETAKGITGLTWIKDRDNASYFHTLVDSSRGANKEIYSNSTSAEASTNDSVTKFLKGGVAVEDAVNVNNSGDSFISWNWVGNSGTTSTNDASSTGVGTIDSTYQVNTTAGFSIVQRTGTGSAGTVAHGLGKAPAWIFSKNLSTTESWPCWHQSITAAKAMFLNLTNAPASSTQYNSTAPTSTVFSVGATDGNNKSGSSHIDWVWCEVDGFSKFGKFVGNGNADGPFIYTGFTPAWIVFKANRVTNWYQNDGVRSPFNPVTIGLDLNSSAAEYDGGVYVGGGVDYLSNGFKIRQGTGLGYNYTGEEIYYMCFAEHPFVGDGTNPVTAR